MHLPGYYSSGEFACMAKVSLRTIRFYDKKNILKPSYVNDNGARFYTDKDFVRLQQILLLKYLGFSLDEIHDLLITDDNYHFLLNSLNIQKKLVQERMEQLQLIANTIDETTATIKQAEEINWSNMLELIHLTNMEQSLKKQYQDASNISARINLHKDYSVNKQGWFPWIFEQCSIRSNMHILELGCGDGSLWSENLDILDNFEHLHITLSDISEGMLRDAKRNIGENHSEFTYNTFDCHQIPYKDEAFDLVIANHVLFYCNNLSSICNEVFRVLKPNGIFICSTYGKHHMEEITKLVQQFDPHIVLSGECLYEKFGLENGSKILANHFSSIEQKQYVDAILIDSSEPLVEYILSCHGNQNQYLTEKYNDFRLFLEKKLQMPLHITKEAGIFICKKE